MERAHLLHNRSFELPLPLGGVEFVTMITSED
jgi:hypothetical protein